eukprot:scaffold4470_cov255-Prasinococcus_capsulatus_cf.AAC.19
MVPGEDMLVKCNRYPQRRWCRCVIDGAASPGALLADKGRGPDSAPTTHTRAFKLVTLWAYSPVHVQWALSNRPHARLDKQCMPARWGDSVIRRPEADASLIFTARAALRRRKHAIVGSH